MLLSIILILIFNQKTKTISPSSLLPQFVTSFSSKNHLKSHQTPLYITDLLSKQQTNSLPSCLIDILQQTSKQKIKQTLHKKEYKENFKTFICQSEINLKTTFLILNKVLNDPSFVIQFFDTLKLNKKEQNIVHSLNYEKYQQQLLEPSYGSPSFSMTLHNRLKTLFKGLLLTPPSCIIEFKKAHHFLQKDELETIKQHFTEYQTHSILITLIYQDCLHIIETTFPFIQPNIPYIELLEDPEQFFEELKQVKQSDILHDYGNLIGKGKDGEIYNTKKKRILAKIANETPNTPNTPNTSNKVSQFLNRLYGYRFSRVDDKNPSIMYMQKIEGETWSDMANRVDIQPQTKGVILEHILNQIHLMNTQGMLHNDLHDENFIVNMNNEKPLIYLIDPDCTHYAPHLEQTFIERIKREYDSHNKNTNNPKCTLHEACTQRASEKIKQLLQQGSDPNIKDKKKQTPLIIATEQQDLESIKLLLLHRADIHAVDRFKKSSLMIATQKKNTPIIEYLLEKGADPNQTDNVQTSSLMIAAQLGFVKGVKVLLKQKGIDPKLKNKWNQTALDIAVEYKQKCWDNTQKKDYDQIIDMLERENDKTPSPLDEPFTQPETLSQLHLQQKYSLEQKNTKILSST